MASLTTKELTLLEEQLRSEQILVAKYRDMANNVQDVALKTSFSRIADKHQQHYNNLFNYMG
jgi:rubrerythrin